MEQNLKKSVVITFANQKGGVGKTTLCTLFANYLAAKGKSLLVVDCDGQQTIYEKRKGDMKSFPDMEIPYNIQPFNISNIEHVKNLMNHIQTMDGVILIDAPGSLSQKGLIPLFISTDFFVCPYQFEQTSIKSTVPRVEQAMNMQRYNTLSLIANQDKIVGPAFDYIYKTIFENELEK